MADVRISTSETLDAFRTAELVGYRDRRLLKDALATVLPKTAEEKDAFDACFEQFFHFEALSPDDPHGDAAGADAAERGAQGERDGAQDPDAAEDTATGEGERQGGGGAQSAERPSRQQAGGEPADAPPDPEEALERAGARGPMPPPESALGKLLMRDDPTALSMAIAEAAREVELDRIQVFTQKGLYTRRMLEAMGLAELQREIGEREASERLADRRLGRELERRRERLRDHIKDHVERQFQLHADASGDKLREEMLQKVKLSNVEQRNMRHVRRLVQKMAKRLVARHSRRKKVTKRGQLDVTRTLRRNMRYEGTIVDLSWKSTRVDRPKVFAICDVSGSVAQYARFMLMFLYSVEEVLPGVRAFAFSSHLGEVTDLFHRKSIDDAIAETLREHAGGSTDYGQAFADFSELALNDVDNRSTVIILGDGRNNYGDPRTELLKTLYDRCRRLIWLNPEPPTTWGTGDSEIRRYRAYASQVDVCNSLVHLERVVSNILRATSG